MAKISARGDREKWRRQAARRTFVYTVKGRLLVKIDGFTGYTLVGKMTDGDAHRRVDRLAFPEAAR